MAFYSSLNVVCLLLVKVEPDRFILFAVSKLCGLMTRTDDKVSSGKRGDVCKAVTSQSSGVRGLPAPEHINISLFAHSAWPVPVPGLACKSSPSTIEMIQFMHLPQTHTDTRACTPELLTWATLTVATATFDYGYIT